MNRSFVLLSAVLLIFPAVLIRAQDDTNEKSAPSKPEPFPAAYKNDVILPGSESPDGKYALIFLKRELQAENDARYDRRVFLIALKPFRVLTKVPLRYSGLWREMDEHSFVWAEDSSAMTLNEGLKWGPDKVFVVAVKDGRANKPADLTAAVEKIVRPDFKKSKAAHFNDETDFIFESRYITPGKGRKNNEEEQWQPGEPGQVTVKCFCTSDPKDLGESSWTVRFEGTWDIVQRKFIQQKVTHLPSGPDKGEGAAE